MYANGNTIGTFIGHDHDHGIGAIAGAIGRSRVVRFTLKLIAAAAFIVMVALIAFVMPVSADTIGFGEIEPDQPGDQYQELIFRPNLPSDFMDSVTFSISDSHDSLLVAIQVFSFGSGPDGSLLGLEIDSVVFTQPVPNPDPQFTRFNAEGLQFQGLLGPGDYVFDIDGTSTGTVGGHYAVVISAVVPEPGTASLAALGLTGLGILGRRRPR